MSSDAVTNQRIQQLEDDIQELDRRIDALLEHPRFRKVLEEIVERKNLEEIKNS